MLSLRAYGFDVVCFGLERAAEESHLFSFAGIHLFMPPYDRNDIRRGTETRRYVPRTFNNSNHLG